MISQIADSFKTIALGCTLVVGLAWMAACASCKKTTPPEPPPPEVSRVKPCVTAFDLCRCDLQDYSLPTLTKRLRQPSSTPNQREALAANLSSVAIFYKNRYWKEENPDDAARALRFYDAYLTLVKIGDELAPHSLLHSIAIYCDMGCLDKANDLAQEVRKFYNLPQNEIGNALSYCYDG